MTDECRDEFEKRCLADGLIKMNSEEELNVTFFEPTVQALIGRVIGDENKKGFFFLE